MNVMNLSSASSGKLCILDLDHIQALRKGDEILGSIAQTYAHSWGTGNATFGEAFAFAPGPISRTNTSVYSNAATYGTISSGYGSANAFASSSSLDGFKKSNSWSNSNSLSFSSHSSF